MFKFHFFGLFVFRAVNVKITPKPLADVSEDSLEIIQRVNPQVISTNQLSISMDPFLSLTLDIIKM